MLPQIYIQDKTWWCFFKNNCKTMGVTLYRGTPGGQIPKFWEKMVCRNDVTRKIGVSWRIFSYWWNLTPRNKPVKVFYFLKMDLRTDSSVVWQLILNHNVMFCPKCNISGKSFVKFEAHIIRKNIKNLGGSFRPTPLGMLGLINSKILTRTARGSFWTPLGIPHILSVLNDFAQMDRTNGSSEVFILKWQTNHNLHRSQNPQNHLKIV